MADITAAEPLLTRVENYLAGYSIRFRKSGSLPRPSSHPAVGF
jgi:hypothetical protein